MQAPPFPFPFFPSLAQPPTAAASSCPAPPSMMQSSDVASMLSLLNQRMTMIEQLLTLQQHTNDTLFRTVQLMQQTHSHSSSSMPPTNQIKTLNVSDVDPAGNRCLDEDGAEIHVVMVSEGSADVPSSSDLFSSPLSVRGGPRRVAI